MKREINKNYSSQKTWYKRIYAFACLCVFALQLFAISGKDNISIKKNKISVKDAFSSVKQQAKVFVMYENNSINEKQLIDLNLSQVSLQTAMNEICKQAGLKYEVKGQYVLVTRDKHLIKGGIGENHVTGKVIDDTGMPLIGATVLVVGKNTGTITDENGYYKIKASNGDKLRFSYIGMKSIDRNIGNNNVINIAFDSRSHNLNEIVVVSNGYQALPKDRATGSFSSISAKDLKKVPTPNVIQRLEGQVAGMKISLMAGDKTFTYDNTLQSANSTTRTLGASDYSLGIRGVNTLSGEKMPLLVVDGVISDLDISNIDPNNIDNITILKDAAAASIWGARAANGVIVITTKKGENGQKPQISVSTSWTTQDKPDLGYLNEMTSAQVLDYEKEIVDKGYLYNSSPTTYYGASQYFNEGVRLALDLKNGAITQDQYDSRITELSSINNHSQISKYLLRRASSQQYNASVSGGSNKSSYYYSASYSKENPYTKKNSGSRLNLNLSNTWKLFNWATLTTNFTGTFFKYMKNGTDLNTIVGSRGVIALMPYANLADENGNGINYDTLNPAWTSTLSSAYKTWTYNYLQEMALRDDIQKTDNYTANINLTVPIYAGLSSSTTYAIQRSYTNNTIWYDPDTYYLRNMMNVYTPSGASTNSLGIKNGALAKSKSEDSNWTFREQLNFNQTFNGLHKVNALAGLELRETYVEQSNYTLWGYNRDTGLTDANIDMTSNATYPTIYGYNQSFIGGGYPNNINRKRRFLSYYSNAGYTLMDKYYVSASVRYDDYNNFGLDRKYRAKPFYSFGLKWNLSREKFMENVKWVNNLAIRATYGINGNISLGAYPFTKIMYSSNYITNQPSASISSLANPELRWEKTYTTNFGIDFSLLKNRLSGSIDYYNKRSRDLLYKFPFSSTVVGNINNSTMTYNCVGINANGIDLNLRGIAFQDKDWKVEISSNLAWNQNKVQKNPLFKEEQYLSYINNNARYIGMIAGYSTDKLFAYRFAGLDENGQTMVYDENDNKVKFTEDITSLKALKCVGHSQPSIYGGFNINVSWKNFSLFSLFTYQFGSKFFKPTFSQYATNSRRLVWDLSDDIADRWRVEGDEAITNVPGILPSSNYKLLSRANYSINRYKYSDINIEKGDYLRWRQISLSYRLANDLLKTLHIQSANVSLSISNLGLLWKANKAGLDPDFIYGVNSTTNLPPKKAYTLSININF